MARKIISERLTPEQLRQLRAKPFLERNKIIQDKLNMEMRQRTIKLRLEEKARRVLRSRLINGRQERFIF